MSPRVKDRVQRQIEYMSLAIWVLLCGMSLVTLGTHFALGVFLGGALCLINHQWLYRHARLAVTMPPKMSSGYMVRRYLVRLTTLGFIIFALIAWAHVNVIALLVGLSVVVLSIVSYACFTYISAEGD